MIEIKQLTKTFGTVVALKELSCTISEGSCFGLVGSNGSGKSTLLRILSGVYTQDSGEILIDGDISYDNPAVKNNCFFISDYPFFYNNSTITNTADLYKRIYTGWSTEKYNKLCRLFPIDKKAKIINMSKGMQRQAALILGLSTCPKYLFLDEIFDGLDPVVRQLVKKLIIQDISENNMTVIIASHNLRELDDISDHVGLLHKGGILLEKDLDELKLGIHRIQIAFNQRPPQSAFDNLSLVDLKATGNLYSMVARGKKEDIISKLNALNPVFIEALPLTLEEIFISEMEVAGYDIDNIIG